MGISRRAGLLAPLTVVVATFAFAAPGDLDPSFGALGVTRTTIGAFTLARASALQPDGKIVVAGKSDGRFLVMRYDEHGVLDPSFGSGGIVTTPIGDDAGARGVVVQNDGMVVAAGTSTASGQPSFTLARYDDGGTLDPDFGNGGIVTTPLAAAECEALVLQDDGRLVAGGTSDAGGGGEFTLIRYETDGSLDATFGVGGVVATALSADAYVDTVHALEMQNDQNVVACGRNSQNGFAVARYDTSGTLDAGFATGGVYTFGGLGMSCQDLAVHADGRITAVGAADSSGFYSRGRMMLRLLPDGTLDPTLVSNLMPYIPYGVRAYAPSPSQYNDFYLSYAVGLDSVERILTAGHLQQSVYGGSPSVPVVLSTTRGFLRNRANTDGIDDNTFAAALSLPNADSLGARSLVVQPDDRLVAVGNESPNRVTIARYRSGICGNGAVEPDEPCDDGNEVEGDGCDTNCTLTGCGNGIVTAGEACDAGHPDPANCCTTACTPVPAAQTCPDDGNLCSDDACDGAGNCAHPANTLACDDENSCTTDDICSAGTCGGTAVECAPCEECNVTNGICEAFRRYDCAPENLGSSEIDIRDSEKDSGDRVDWKLRHGFDYIDLEDFGDPLTTDDYLFCLYDDAATPRDALVFGARIPAGGLCGQNPCWRATGTKGFRYNGSRAQLDGVRSLRLKANSSSGGSIRLKGGGALLSGRPGGLPVLPLPLPLRAQIHIQNGECWESRYSNSVENAPSRFRAESE